MKNNIFAGALLLLLSLTGISCNDTTDDTTGTEVSDTMTMPATTPAHTDTNTHTPPAVADTTRNMDTMPVR